MTNQERDELILSNLVLAERAAAHASPRGGIAEREDLLAAARLGLVEAAQRFDPAYGVKFSSFARWRVTGAVIDSLRRNGALPAMVREGYDEGLYASPGGSAEADRAIHWQHLREAVRRLPEQQREIILSHYGEGLSLTEIAARDGCTKSWVSRLHARALQALREFDSDHGTEQEQEQERER